MDTHEQDIDRLVSRALDGALDEDQQLSLNRAQLRDPELHGALDDARALDGAAGEVLRSSVPDRSASLDPVAWIEGVAQEGAPRRRHLTWWLVPGSVAAALMGWLLSGIGLEGSRTDGRTDGRTSGLTGPVASDVQQGAPLLQVDPGAAREALPSSGTPRMVNGSGDAVMRPAMERPHEFIRRDIDREILGVSVGDGVLYWIELDRLRTVKKRDPSRLYRGGGEEL